MNLHDLDQLTRPWKADTRMPALFIGHGSPMNALEDNAFTRDLQQWGKGLPRPKAVLVVSAHWETRGSWVSVAQQPATIHDFGGFPKALFEVQYPAPGAPEEARMAAEVAASFHVGLDSDYGLDHGAWSVLRHLFPNADVPVFQLSLDHFQGPEYHYRLAKQLLPLRERGVLILGSGNLVHNLGILNCRDPNATPFDWAAEFDTQAAESLEKRDHSLLLKGPTLSAAARLAIPTAEHFLPLLYTAALQTPEDDLRYIHEGFQHGSISMRSFQVG